MDELEHTVLQALHTVCQLHFAAGAHAQLPQPWRLHGNAQHIVRPAPDHQLRHHGDTAGTEPRIPKHEP